jgi:hypothetical protein
VQVQVIEGPDRAPPRSPPDGTGFRGGAGSTEIAAGATVHIIRSSSALSPVRFSVISIARRHLMLSRSMMPADPRVLTINAGSSSIKFALSKP